MKHLSRTLTLLVLMAMFVLLAACGSSTPAPAATPAPVATAEPVATAAPEVATAAPIATVSNTAASTETTTSTAVTETAAVSETTPVTSSAATLSDPFAYCASVGTIDAPAAPYDGPAVPESVAKSLQVALNLPDLPLDVLSNGTSWRCMDSKVYGCYVGANLPCSEKGDNSETPTQPEIDFCAADGNANAEAIPATVTGSATVYSWRCTDGKPAIVEQVYQIDAQGFIQNVWYPLTEQ